MRHPGFDKQMFNFLEEAGGKATEPFFDALSVGT
jgi:hypothetical protein